MKNNKKENEKEIVENKSELKDQKNSNDKTNKTKTKKPLDSKNKIEELKQKNISLLAEMENLRKIHANERNETAKYFLSSFLHSFLPSLEMFENALKTKNVSDELKNWLIGFEMILKNMKETLEKQGVTEIKVKPNDEFNSNLHEAIDEEYSDKIKHGKILKVKQIGYKLNDRLIRPTTVILSKGQKK